jgi:hypothetical protein
MTVGINIDLDEVVAWVEVAQQMPEMTEREATVAMRLAVDRVQREVKSNPATPVNTGALANAFSTKVSRGSRAIKGEIVNPLVYALVMEKGRRAGARQPPTDAIQFWVTRKLGIRGKAAEQLAFVIARSIGRKGIKGRHMLEKSMETAEPSIRRIFAKVPETVFNRLK